MTAVLFLGVIPPSHLPDLMRGVRLAVPGTLAVDALSDGFRSSVPWADAVVRLLISVGYGAGALLLAARAFRRAVDR